MTRPPKKRFIFTLIKNNILLVLVACLWLVPPPARAAHTSDDAYDSLYKRIAVAVENENEHQTDFLVARYLGTSFLDPDAKKGPKDLEEFIKKRALAPYAFLSGEYDKEFVDWFVKSSYANWGVDEAHVREKSDAFEIRSVTNGKYFLTVTSTPELESWFVAGADASPLIVAAGSTRVKPLIYSGKVVNRVPMIYFPVVTLDVGRRHLLYLWRPDFYDFDEDGIPEILLRYNLTSDNGFTQILAIYRIEKDNRLKLMRKFSGESEGVARKLADEKIQVGSGIGSKASVSHMSFDRTHFETWEFANGDFKKVSEENTAHILRSEAWKKYFLDTRETWMKKYS